MGAVSIAVLVPRLRRDPAVRGNERRRDTVGKASLGALMLVGSLFYPANVDCRRPGAGMTFSSLDTAFYDTANLAGGLAEVRHHVVDGDLWGIANALVAQAAVSRILFAMGAISAAAAGEVHLRLKTPYVSTLFVALICWLPASGSTAISITSAVW